MNQETANYIMQRISMLKMANLYENKDSLDSE